MKTNTQLRASFYRFAMSASMALFGASIFFFVTDSHAMSVSYKEKLCERNFYGSNYKPYLEKTCGLLWSHWSYQILNTFE